MNYDNSNVAPSTKDGGAAIHKPPNTPITTATQPTNNVLSESKLRGCVFLYGASGVGEWSVHFDEEVGCYYSCEHFNYSSYKFDDGSELPSPRRFYFSDISYDSVETRFTGLAEYGGTLRGNVSMKFDMVFDTEFVCVLSGSFTYMKVDGEKGNSYTIGEHLTYTNASLDGRVDGKTLQRLEDEGASEKSIVPFRHPRIQELVQRALRDEEEKEAARRLREIALALRDEEEKEAARRLREIALHLNAKSSNMDDQIKILKELLNNTNSKEIDDFIKTFRSYGPSQGATFENTTSSSDDIVLLEEFLGKVTFETLKSDLDEFGVIAVEDFNELDEEDINHLGGKLKKVNAKRFHRKVAEIRKSV